MKGGSARLHSSQQLVNTFFFMCSLLCSEVQIGVHGISLLATSNRVSCESRATFIPKIHRGYKGEAPQNPGF